MVMAPPGAHRNQTGRPPRRWPGRLARAAGAQFPDGSGQPVFFQNFNQDFLPVDLDVVGRLDAQAHGFPFHFQYGDANVIVDGETFADFAGEHEHGCDRR